METALDYYGREFAKVSKPNSIKVRGDENETHWLNINTESVKALRDWLQIDYPTDLNTDNENLQAHIVALEKYNNELREVLSEALDQLESWNPDGEDTFTMKRARQAIEKAING